MSLKSEFNPNTFSLEPGIRLLEASAGTGKTFSIAHLVLRLLTEKQHSINEILVVSYTRASAAEIKARITNRLLFALKALENPSKKNKTTATDQVLDEWLKNIDKGKEQRMEWVNQLLDALANIDQADITTIHGFCRRTLQKDVIESGSTIEPKPIHEEENKKILSEIAHEYWSKNILSLAPQDLKGIKQAGINPESIANKALAIEQDPSLELLIEHKEVDTSVSLDEQFKTKFKAYWERFIFNWEKDGAGLDTDFKNIAKSYRDMGVVDTKPYSPNPRKDRYIELNEWIKTYQGSQHGAGERTSVFYGDIRSQKLLKDYFHPLKLSEVERRNQLDDSSLIRPSLQNAIADLIDKPAELVWLHAIGSVLESLKIKRLKAGSISFSDQLKALDPDSKHLDGGNAAKLQEKLRHRYKVVLIDEFQDTDPLQWRIFNKTFGKSSTHLLLMVGDPKQAIYKFRGGDLNTYLQARKEADSIDSLLTNYRASTTLLNSLNQMMTGGLKYSGLDVPSLKSGSGRKILCQSAESHPLEILTLKPSSNEKSSSSTEAPSKNKVEPLVPDIVTKAILELINRPNNAVRPNDICVLVNRHSQADDVRRSLGQSGIPSRIVNQGDVFDSEAAGILQRFMDCLSSPSYINKLRLLVCSPLMQWDINRLKEAEENKEIDNLILQFTKWGDELHELGLVGCLSNFLEGKNIANLSKMERTLGDLFQCAQLVQEVIHNQGLDARGAARWLRQQRIKVLDPTPNDRRPNSDIEEEAINVITIHRSKGLEFKVVLCPYLWQSPSVPKGPLWRDDTNKSWLISMNPGWGEKKHIFNRSITEANEEAERLAYVALTRAQDKLIVIWIAAFKQENNPLKFFLFGPSSIDSKAEDLTFETMRRRATANKLNIHIRQVDTRKAKDYWTKLDDKEILKLGPTPKRKLDKSWGRHSYSSWISNTYTPSERTLSPETIDEGKDLEQQIDALHKLNSGIETAHQKKSTTQFNWSQQGPLHNFPRGPLAGDCLHKILEKIDFNLPVTDKLSELVIVDELRRSGIDGKHLVDVQDALKRVLNIRLGSSLGNLRLKDIDTKNMINELGFDLCLSKDGKPIKTFDLEKVLSSCTDRRFGKAYSDQIKELNIYSRGFLTGSIDLVFNDQHESSEQRWWVADWKSNWIGMLPGDSLSTPCGPANYDAGRMEEEMVRHHYPLQANLYLVALHRFLKWRLPGYSPNKHLGGYVYVFLRGIPDEEEVNVNKSCTEIPGLIIEEASVHNILELDQLINVGGE